MLRFTIPLLLCALARAGGAPRPIVGVLTLPGGDGCVSFSNNHTNATTSCFTAFYAQWIEAAGGRVAPIPYNAPTDVLDNLFASVNAILFTGGDINIENLSSPYMRTASHLLNRTIASNAAGDYVPLWGTCLGIQTLSVLVAQSASVLVSQHGKRFDSEGLMLPLELTKDAASSRILGQDAPADVRRIVVSNPLFHPQFLSFRLGPPSFTRNICHFAS